MKPPRPHLFSVLAMSLLVAILPVGCSNFKVNENRNKGIVLPKSQMEADSVALRLAVAQLDDHQKEDFESFLSTTDPKLPLATRQRLDENGMRVSVVSSVNTSQLQKLLSPTLMARKWLDDQERALADAGKLEPVFRIESQRHVEKKRGESFRVEVSPLRPESTWRIFIGPRSQPAGQTGRAKQAQCQMRITSWPKPDGSVLLSFLPEIHHGQNLSRIGVDDSNFAIEQRREIEPLHSLAFELSLRVGETVVVAPTRKLERLGALFFDAAAGDDEQPDHPAKPEPLDEAALELFPMLEEDSSAAGPEKLADKPVDPAIPGRPQPWQRFLLVRVSEVTRPALP